MKATRTTDEILDLVTFRKNGANRMRPNWFDSFKIVLADMDYSDTRKQELINWLFSNDPESLLYADVQTLDDEDCHELFTTVLQIYKRENMSSTPRRDYYFIRNLASFCRSKESIRYLIDEINEQEKPSAYLYLLTNVYSYLSIDVVMVSKMESPLKEVAYEKLLDNYAYDGRWLKATFFPFNNGIFATKEDLLRLTDYAASIKHPAFLSKIFDLIENTDLCNDFVDFAIENESNVKDYFDRSSNATCCVSRDSLLYVMSHVSTYDAVRKMWLFLPDFAEHKHGYNSEELDNLRSSLLAKTSTLIEDYPDLETLVDMAWQKEYKDCYWSLEGRGNLMFSAYREFMARYGKRSVDDYVDEFISQIRESAKSADFDLPRAGIYLRITVEDVNRFAEKWNADDEKKCCVMANLKYTPLDDVNVAAKYWSKKKFTKAIEPFDDLPSPEETRRKEISELLDYERFKELVMAISKDLEGKDMNEARRKARDLNCRNNFILQYLQHFYSYKSRLFDLALLKESLDDILYYYCHIVRIFGEDSDTTFTDEQRTVLETAATFLLTDKRTDKETTTKCLNLIRIQGFELDYTLVEKYFKQAGKTYEHTISNTSYNFLDYALSVYGYDKVGAKVESILNGEWENIDEDSLFALVEFAAKLKITGCYQSVCDKIVHKENASTYAYYLLKHDYEGTFAYLKANFDEYGLSTQIHIVNTACGKDMDLNKKWAIKKLYVIQHLYDVSEHNQAKLTLLRLGDESALDWCVEMAEKDITKLCGYSSAPSLGYDDIKYLPKLLRLLMQSWEQQEDYIDGWCDRVKDALEKMAIKNNEQHDAVVRGLEKMRDSDNKYASLNFFINFIKSNYNPCTKSEGFTVRDASEFIKSNP